MNNSDSLYSPFKTIALAIAFSPTSEALIAESRRIQELFGARLVLVHVGEKTGEKEELMNSYVEKYSITNCIIEWQEGNIVNVLLKSCMQHQVDLLIAGALIRDSFIKYYVGSIARKLIRKADFSVLLLQSPSVAPKSFNKIILAMEDEICDEYYKKAFAFIEKENTDDVFVVKEAQMSAFNLMMNDEYTERESINIRKKLIESEQGIVKKALSNIRIPNIRTKILYGKQGYEFCTFARCNCTDLAIIPAPGRNYNFFDRVFKHDLEYILEDLPCNLLMVHE